MWDESNLSFPPSEYLPKAEERVGRLRRIIGGRPVAIIAAGSSIRQLEERIVELREANICYFGLNGFRTQERHILQRIDRRFSVAMCSAREHMPDYIRDVTGFLDREEDNVLVSSFWRNTFELMDRDFDLDFFLTKYDRKLLFFGMARTKDVPNCNLPLHFIESNSLLVLIQLAVIGGASRIVLFGADGHATGMNGNAYYRGVGDSDPVRRSGLVVDVNRYFNPIASIALRNVYETHRLRSTTLNCSEVSSLTPFPKVSYDTAFRWLLKGGEFDPSDDLRVPRVSVVSTSAGALGSLKDTVESLSEQSYACREHIVVHGETADEAEALKDRFPGITCIPRGHAGLAEALRKGLCAARGEYVCWCPIGDTYVDRDWINGCVEVLENDPDISLVSGLPQELGEGLGAISARARMPERPAQGKWFIYHWLKRKTLFPEGTICVRRAALEACFPFEDRDREDDDTLWLTFNYRFNTLGYLPYFLPGGAASSRLERPNGDCRSQRIAQRSRQRMPDYEENVERYRKRLLSCQVAHRYRRGAGELIGGGFSIRVFAFFDLARYVGRTMPTGWLRLLEMAVRGWSRYRWRVLNIGGARIWRRVTAGFSRRGGVSIP